MRHDIATQRIVAAGACIAGAVVLVVGAIVFVLRESGMPLDGRRDVRNDVAIPGPALESAPQPDMQRYRDEKARRLASTGWVDARAGIAHIPIDAAMALMAQRGLRAVPGGEEAQR